MGAEPAMEAPVPEKLKSLANRTTSVWLLGFQRLIWERLLPASLPGKMICHQAMDGERGRNWATDLHDEWDFACHLLHKQFPLAPNCHELSEWDFHWVQNVFCSKSRHSTPWAMFRSNILSSDEKRSRAASRKWVGKQTKQSVLWPVNIMMLYHKLYHLQIKSCTPLVHLAGSDFKFEVFCWAPQPLFGGAELDLKAWLWCRSSSSRICASILS